MGGHGDGPPATAGSTRTRSQERLDQPAYVRGHNLRLAIGFDDVAAAGIAPRRLQKGVSDDVEVAKRLGGVVLAVRARLAARACDLNWAIEDDGEVGHGRADHDGRHFLVEAREVDLRHRDLKGEGRIEEAVGHDPGARFDRRLNYVSHVIVAGGADEQQLFDWRQNVMRVHEDSPHLRAEATAVWLLCPNHRPADAPKVFYEDFGLPGLAASIHALDTDERHAWLSRLLSVQRIHLTMHRSSVVAFVSAGMPAPKKRDHLLARRQLYLNYGALSLATMLKATGLKTMLVHGEHREPAEVVEQLLAADALPSSLPLMLSVPSFYALPWAQELCRIVRRVDPTARIVVGGRWVVGPDVDWLRVKLPEANVLVPGLGEPVIASLLTDAPDLRRLPAPTPDFTLDHTLVTDQLSYQPSVETSRGCGMGCAFCEERDIRLEKLRGPELIAEAMAEVQAQYGGDEIRPYLQASLFAPSAQWSAAFAAATAERGLRIAWRTESRVDALLPAAIEHLAQAGLKVLDLGLETASPTQILRMRKSKLPDRYLARASELLAACRAHGVHAKVNVLLYAGETAATLDETRRWLDDHAAAISGVSVGPVVAYGPPKTARILLDDWEQAGATAVDPLSADTTGITMVHLSRDFDAQAAEAASLELSRRYMDADEYFRLKSFSYYPRGYTRTDFDRDVAGSAQGSLPFRTAT